MTRIGIIVFPGSNCERDVQLIINKFLKIKSDFIWHTHTHIDDYDAIVLPGGFAYGDRLRAGIIAAHSPIMHEVKKLAEKGRPILGICNGFQILVEAGLLPGALITNNVLQFTCKWVRIKVINNTTPFTNLFEKFESISVPIAHGEGRYLINSEELKSLREHDQIVFEYQDFNPNGSVDMIAGICNRSKNVLGMMPHPERASDPLLLPKNEIGNSVNIFNSLIWFITNSIDVCKFN